MEMFTLDEARVYLQDHALTEGEQAICRAVWTVIEDAAGDDEEPIRLVQILTHVLTDAVCAVLAEQCPGNAEEIARRVVICMRFIEWILHAKIIVAGGFIQ